MSFDLRGLPPSLAEIDAFLADESTDAYERLVDRFLADEHFGERMAMEWMDIARYADSHGYQDDLERSMWPWRDWVIKAFNDNMPYDQFVSWQLAGDMLHDATYEQKLATGFNRNHKITQEVGVIDEEYRVTYVLDRVNTFSTVFLGLTVECAQCHDHKYDPISQKEYYSLFSFFNNVPEKGRVDYGVEVAAPYLPLPEEKAKDIRNYIHSLFDKQKQKREAYIRNKWSDNYDANELSTIRRAATSSLPGGLVAWYPMDHLENGRLQEMKQANHGEAKAELIPVPGKFAGGVEFMGRNYGVLGKPRSFDLNQAFTISFWIKSLDGGIRGPALRALSTRKRAIGNPFPKMEISITGDKTLDFSLGEGNASIQIRSKETLPPKPLG